MNAAPVLRVYLDANVLIYIVDGTEPFRSSLQTLLSAVDDGRVRCFTSELTVRKFW